MEERMLAYLEGMIVRINEDSKTKPLEEMIKDLFELWSCKTMVEALLLKHVNIDMGNGKVTVDF